MEKNNLQQLPDKLKPMKVSSREDANTIGFFGELCPFSNFYEAEFIWNGYIYHSSEQYIQHQKAKYCGDTAAANEIMSCKTALQCKCAARNIDNYIPDDWIKFATSECVKGLTAKFDQNPKLKALLLSTGDKMLVECSWDRVWGTGYPLSKPDCLDSTNWEKQGILGSMLMTVREKLKPVAPPHALLNTYPQPLEPNDHRPKRPQEPPATKPTAMDTSHPPPSIKDG